MSAMGPSLGSSSGWSMMCTSIGHTNAAVFPLPVFAMPIRSRPLSAPGMACDWMGVGCTNSVFRIIFIMFSSKPKCAKLVTGFGGDGPVTRMPRCRCRSSTWLRDRLEISSCGV